MSQTKTEVINRAANMLGVLAFGQSLASQDSTRITQGYNEVYAYLKNKGLATWASTASVPDELVFFMASMIAYSCINDYGVSNDRYQRISADANSAEQNIRALVIPAYVSQQDPTDY